MKPDTFEKLLKFIDSMNADYKEELYYALKESIEPIDPYHRKIIEELRETKFSKGLVCPRCDGKEVVRFGKYNNRQRYKCKSCNKTFSDFTRTPLYKTKHPGKWIRFIECMIEGKSLRKSQKIVGVSYVTLFYWRHKILNALKQDIIEAFNGIVEMDETYLLFSEKGKKKIADRKPRKRGGKSKYRGISKEQMCILVARDRNRNTIAKTSCMGRIVKSKVESVVGSYLSSANVLCTDKWRAYKKYCEEKDIQHYRIKPDESGHVIKGLYHIQNVNNYHARFKKWLDRFNGVASKYLNNYLTWFKFLDSVGYENTINCIKEMLITGCLHKVYDTYHSIRTAKFSIP
ncbi:MAG: IS1595 family transposase [Clostridiaceae bacterium]|nr:IS1595 family transposase [Clostridiaceae bacterium]